VTSDEESDNECIIPVLKESHRQNVDIENYKYQLYRDQINR